jgi:plastocyanin
MRVALMSVGAVLVLLAGCSSSTSPSGGANSGAGQGQGGSQTTISVSNNFFTPSPDTVSAGQVTFSWSVPSNGHNVTWDSGPGTLPPPSATLTSGTYVATLQVGTYAYHCTIHGTAGSGMRGTIVVH